MTARRWYPWLLGALLLAPLVLALIAYSLLPAFAPWLLARSLAGQGMTLQALHMERPGLGDWRIERLAVARDNLQVELTQLQLNYALSELVSGRLQSLQVASLRMHVQPGEPAPNQPQPASLQWLAELPQHIDPGYWLAQLPWQRLQIQQAQLAMPAADLLVTGRVEQQQRSLVAEFALQQPALVAGARARLGYSVEQGLVLEWTDPAAAAGPAPLQLRSRFGRNTLDLRLAADLQGEMAALVARLLDQPELNFRGRFDAHTRLPWPLPADFGVADLVVLGQLEFDAQWPSELALDAVGGLLSLRGGVLDWTLDTGALRYHDSVAGLQVDCALQEPVLVTWQAAALDVSDGLGCTARQADEQVRLTLEQLRYAQDGTAASPRAAASTAQLALTVGYDAIIASVGPVQGSAQARFVQHSATELGGQGVVRVSTPLLQPASVPVTLRFWPAEARGELDLTLRAALSPRPLERLQWAEAVDLDSGQFDTQGTLRWHDSQWALSLAGSFRGIQLALRDMAAVPRPLQGDYRLQWTDSALSADGQVQAGVLTVPYNVRADTRSADGTFRLSVDQIWAQPLFKSVLKDWDTAFDLNAGRLQGAIDGSWSEDGAVTFAAELALADGVAQLDEYPVDGVQTTFRARGKGADLTASGDQLTIAQMDVGFPVTQIEATGWRYAQDDAGSRLRLDTLGARLLGGSLSVADLVVDLDTVAARFPVALNDLSVADILALEGEDISGTGRIDGLLPVVLEAGAVRIAKGTLAARAPGGIIRISNSFAAPTGQPGLDFALQALADFRYSELSALVNYAPDGDLKLAVALKGSNPAIENGRPIHYNVNVSENIPSLLESLQADRLITDQVEQKVERKMNR